MIAAKDAAKPAGAPDSAPQFTTSEKAACAKREWHYRLRVYVRRVQLETMTRAKADREIALMRAIYQDYADLAESDASDGRML